MICQAPLWGFVGDYNSLTGHGLRHGKVAKSDHYEKKKTIQSLLYVCIPEPLTLASDGHQVSCKCAGWAVWGVSVSSLWRECM